MYSRRNDSFGEHFIGVDVGTSSVRACIIDSTGDMKDLATEDIATWSPEAGHHEQSTTDIWRRICACVQKLLSSRNIEPSSIRGIGFDATCSLAVFAYDTGDPVSVTGPGFMNDGNDRNVILWLDHRPVTETKIINSSNNKLLQYVGGKMNPEMEIPKVLWLKNNMPPEIFGRCKFYGLADALTYLATGNDTQGLFGTFCIQGYAPVGVDGSVKGWHEDFYEAVGLADLTRDNYKGIGGLDLNGKCFSAGELVGRLSSNAGNELGLPAGIAVGSGVIDAYAGWIGTVGAKVDSQSTQFGNDLANNDLSEVFSRLAAVAGTSTCLLAMSEQPIFVPGVWGPYQNVLLPKLWMSEGGQSATGELLRHMVETHPAYKEVLSRSKLLEINAYDYLNICLKEMAENVEACSVSYLGRHIFFYGDLWGNRSSIADPNMTGAIIGMSSDRSVEGLALNYYATMECIAMQTRQIVEIMNKAGHCIRSIFMSGSQCQNNIFMELMATVCSVPILIPKYMNAAVVHGAAMLGAKAASANNDGETEDLWSIMKRMSKPCRLILPRGNEADKRLLEIKYSVFLEQSQAQQTYRRHVDEAIKEYSKP